MKPSTPDGFIGAPSADSFRRFSVFAVLIVAVAAAIAGLTNQFTQDDILIVGTSERLHSLAHWREILTSPYWPPPALPDLYRPGTSLLLALEYAVGGGAPIIFRVVSYALYAIGCLAVLHLASRLASRPTALFIALLFAAHPVHVEAVALAVGQSELLVCLLATTMVAHYLHRRTSGGLRGRDWVLLTLCYASATLIKEQGFILLALLVASETCFCRAPARVRVRELWKGYGALAFAGVLILLLRTAVLGAHLGPPVVAESLRGSGIAGRMLTMLRIVPEWFRLLVFPAHLRIDYRPQEFVASTGFGPAEALGVGLILGAAALAWCARRRAPLATFGIAWLAIALFPVSNVLVPTFILLAERTLLLPSLGLVLAIGGAADFLIARVAPRAALRTILASAAGLCVLAGTIRSAFRHRSWRGSYTLAMASVRDAPRNWSVWQGLGDVYFISRRPEEAVSAYLRAVALAPDAWRVRNDLAMRLRSIERDSDAVIQLRLSLEANPRQILPLAELPSALIALGRYEEARRLADSIIAVADAPPLMVWLRHVADSAIAAKAPRGSIRIGIGLHQ